MIAGHRNTLAFFAAGTLALAGAPEEAKAQERDAVPESLPLPSVFPGWRVVTSLYGGWDSNPLDQPAGPADRDYGMGATLAWGNHGRHEVLGLSAGGSRLSYRELSERSTWTGAAALTMGRRFSRNSLLVVTGGLRYDYTDRFLSVPAIGAQLPRTVALGAYGQIRLDLKLGRRASWSTSARYESVGFEEEELIDTRALRLRSFLARQLARREHLSLIYELLRAQWDTKDNDSHALLLGWKHGFSDEWSFEIETGAARVMPPDAVDASTRWLPTGGAALAATTKRTSFNLSYRRSTSPGYGFDRLLYSDTVGASLTIAAGTQAQIHLNAAADRSRDPFFPVSVIRGAYVDMELAMRLLGPVGVAASYRYRVRQYVDEQRVVGHRVGLAVTTEFQSRRHEGRGSDGLR